SLWCSTVAWLAPPARPRPPTAPPLPSRADSFDTILGVDVLHHLARPRMFFEEAARVLAPGGCVAMAEPWVTPLSYPVYRWLHQEGCTLGLDPWQPFGANGAKAPMDGD